MKKKNPLFLICSAILVESFLANAECPVSDGDKDSQFGTLNTQGVQFKGSDRCTWNISPPDNGDHYRLSITVTYTGCQDKFKIKGVPHCDNNTPFILTYVEQDSRVNCGECIESDGCYSFDTYPLKIEFRKDGTGFALSYEFISCTKTTTSPTTISQNSNSPLNSTPGNSSQNSTAYSTTKTFSRKPDAPTSGNSSQNNVSATSAPLGTRGDRNPSTKETPGTDSSTGTLVAIFVPLIIILVIVVIVLVVIVKMRKNKMKSESDSENNHSSTTGGSGFAVANGVDTGVYESIDNHAAAAGTAFGNQAYQTVIGTQTRGSYAIVDDGAVYYSTVAGSGTQNGGLELPTNTYEQVTLDVEVNEYDHVASDTLRTQRNDYDEVALEERRASEDTAVEVNNVLYGEN